MKCQTCGSDTTSDASFCGVCGVALKGGDFQSELAELPMVEFVEAIGRAFENFFKFSGRATRAEFWWFVLFTQLVGLVGLVPIIGWVIGPLASLVLIIPSISLSARRLHDIGKSGWWLMSWVGITILWIYWSVLLIIQIIGLEDSRIPEEEIWETLFKGFVTQAIILGIVSVAVSIWFLVWFVWKGDKGPNIYGPDPRLAVPTQLDQS